MTATTIVIPCYNEAERFDSDRFLEFARAHRDVRFVLVNDGSTDRTLDCLIALRNKKPNQFEVLNLQSNSGKAEAVRQGMLLALDQQPDNVGFWDADLATPLTAIPEFIRILARRPLVEVVAGSRLQLQGHRINRKLIRHWIGRACGWAASLALSESLRDTQCGAKLFRVSRHVHRIFSQPLLARWIFDVELFARLIQLWNKPGESGPGFSERVYELPLEQWDEVPGSSIKSMDFVRAGIELGSIWWHYLSPIARHGHPPVIPVEPSQPGANATRRAA